MRKVLFIEDNQKQREFLVQCAHEINPNLEIMGTDSCKKALKIVNENDIDVFFVDVQLVDGNGIELAKEIRKISDCQFRPIIFVTGVPTKEMEAFHDIHCYDYILKPFCKDTIEKVMKNILNDYMDKVDEATYITLDYKGIKQKINTDDIIFIENRSRKIFILTKNEEIIYKHMTIKKISRELPCKFVQVHQSFLVNKDCVKKLDLNNKLIVLAGTGELVPIGVSFKNGLGEKIYGGT